MNYFQSLQVMKTYLHQKTIFSTLLSLLFVFCFTISLKAQLVAIVGYNGTTGDGLSFVALEDIPGSTVIYFTDREYLSGTNAFNTGEGVWSYTVPGGGMTMGNVVTFTETGTSTNVLAVACTSGSCGTYNLESGSISLASTTAEGVYAYEDTDNNPNNGVSDIYAALISRSTFPASDNPSTDYPTAIVVEGFPAAGDHRDFMDGLRSGTVTRADLENTSNYDAPISNGNQALSTVPFADLVVPVEFISFTAKSSPEQSVMLDWSTATELNNRGFEIEHSLDGKNWRMLDFEPGNGTTDLMATYQYEHKTPNTGTNYYRLKQIDFDGVFAYSTIVSLQISKGQDGQIAVAPNPFQDRINLQWGDIDNTTGTLTANVYNLQGQLVYSERLLEGQQDVSLSELAPGAYMLQISSDDDFWQPVRIVKM